MDALATPVGRRSVRLGCASDETAGPRCEPDGLSSQVRTRVPRSGSAASTGVRARRTRGRVMSATPATTTRRPTVAVAFQPRARRSRTTAGPSDRGRWSIAWTSGTTDFDLDDEQACARRMPGQHVDRAALAPDRERDFDRDLPSRAARAGQPPRRPSPREPHPAGDRAARLASGSVRRARRRAPRRSRSMSAMDTRPSGRVRSR